MGDQFDGRADKRDAKLASGRTQASLVEASQLQDSNAQQQQLLQQHADALAQEAVTHENHRDTIHLDGVQRQENHATQRRANIAARQLGLSETQEHLDADLREKIAALRTDQATQAQHYDAAFESASDNLRTFALDHALSAHQQLTASADKRHIETAVGHDTQAVDDRIDHSQTQHQRKDRWASRDENYLNNRDDNALLHHDEILTAQHELAILAHQRTLGLGTDLQQADQSLRLATSDIAHEKDSAKNNEHVRHESAVFQNTQGRLDDALKLETNAAVSDHQRALDLSQKDSHNDRTLRKRHENINAWKADVLQNNDQNYAPNSTRHERDLAHVKDYVHASELLSVEHASHQEKHDHATRQSGQARWESHGHTQTNNQNTYSQRVDNAAFDYADDTRSHRDAIANLEDEYRVRRALHDNERKAEHPSAHQSRQPKRQTTFDNSREALFEAYSDDFLGGQSRIAGREHSAVLEAASSQVESEKSSRQKKSNRDENYAADSQWQADSSELGKDNRRIETHENDLDHHKNMAQLAHDHQRDTALNVDHHLRQGHEKDRENILLKQTHHSEQVFNQDARKTQTELNRVDNTLDDKSHIAKVAHQHVLDQAYHLTDIEQTHRNQEQRIHQAYADVRSSVDQSTDLLGDRKYFVHSDQVLSHRAATRTQDLKNQLNYAVADKKLAQDEANNTNTRMRDAATNVGDLEKWFVKDKSDKTQARNETGYSVYTRHANELYAEKVEEALHDAHAASDALRSKSQISREYAHDASTNQQYESILHDEAALKLHEMRLAGEQSKAAEAHDALLESAEALDQQQRAAMKWERDRIQDKAAALLKTDEDEQSAKSKLALDKHDETLENHRYAATQSHDTQLKSAQHHQEIARHLAQEQASTTQRIAGQFEILDNGYDNNIASQRLDAVENDLSVAQKHARQADQHALSEKQIAEELESRYEQKLATLTNHLANNLRALELSYINDADNLLMQRHEASAERVTERGNRQDRYDELAMTITGNEQKMEAKGWGGNSLIWWGTNYQYAWDQSWITFDNKLDSVKEWFADYAVSFAMMVRMPIYYLGVAQAHVNYYRQIMVASAVYEMDDLSNSLNLTAHKIGDWLGRVGTRTKNFFTENVTAFFTRFVYAGKLIVNNADEKLSPIVPEGVAAVQHTAVTSEFYQERFQEEISQPARTFATAAKATFWSKLYGFIHGVKSLGSRTYASFRKSVNTVWSAFADTALSIRSAFSQLGNAMRSTWRSFTHGWGRAQRKARRTVVLPAKQTLASADKNRKTGLAYVISRPVAWWRALKHNLSHASWVASTATYPLRESATELGEDVNRTVQYYATDVSNSAVEHSKGFFSNIWYKVRAAFNRSNNLIDNAGVSIVDGAHRVQEHTPNPMGVVESVALNTQLAAATVAIPVALTLNDISTDIETTGANLAHALIKQTHPAREATNSAATGAVHRKDQTFDGVQNTGEKALHGAIRVGAGIKHSAQVAKKAVVHGAQSLAAATEHAASVTSQAIKQYGLQPLGGFLLASADGLIYVIFAADYHLEGASQQIGESVDALLALPGQAVDSAGLVLSNMYDQYTPSISYGLKRSTLTVKYYGEAIVDGVNSVVAVMGDALQVPIEMISDTVESASDALMTCTQQKGHQFALTYHRGAAGLTTRAAWVGYGWTKITDNIAYVVEDTVMSGAAKARATGSNLLNATTQGALTGAYYIDNMLTPVGDAIVDTAQAVAYYGTALVVPAAAMIADGTVAMAHDVSAFSNHAGSLFTQANQARQHRQGKTINAIYYFGARRNEGRKHAQAVAWNGLAYSFSGVWDDVVHTGQTTLAHAKHGMSAVNIPLIHGRMHWHHFIHTMSSWGNFCVFELVQHTDMAAATAADAAKTVTDETYYAFEGCGDAIILNMKGAQVSVMNGTGRYAVKGLIGVGSLGHFMGNLKDKGVNGALAIMHEKSTDLQHVAVETVATLGQAKDNMLDPIVQNADQAYTFMLQQLENARHGLVATAEEGGYQVKSTGLMLMSAGTQKFTGAKHVVQETGRIVVAGAGKTKDDIQKHIRDNYDINYIGERRPLVNS